MFRFEGYTLDVARCSLRAADREIELRPKSFEVLRYLVENADRLVTKEELIKAIWPNVIVNDEALTHCVSEVRQAIGDGKQATIKSVRSRGYRFTAPVSQLPIDDALVSRLARAARPQPMAHPDIGRPPDATVSDRRSIAVLAFVNLTGNPHEEYFSDGVTEDIITELSRFSELMVIARNSTFQYKGKAVDIRQIGRELNARYVLEGSVRREGDRVTAQLIDVATGAHRWAERYDRELSKVFAVQDDLTRAIVTTLAVHVTKAESERTLLKPAAAWKAYDYYLRGAEAYFSHIREPNATPISEGLRLLEKYDAIDT